MADQHRWIYLAYAKGRIEMRIEPNDPERVEALKAVIPDEDRFYMRDRRSWVFNPRWTAEVVTILRAYCAGFQIVLEEQNADLLVTLLEGPGALMQPTIAAPRGRLFGNVEQLSEREGGYE